MVFQVQKTGCMWKTTFHESCHNYVYSAVVVSLSKQQKVIDNRYIIYLIF